MTDPAKPGIWARPEEQVEWEAGIACKIHEKHANQRSKKYASILSVLSQKEVFYLAILQNHGLNRYTCQESATLEWQEGIAVRGGPLQNSNICDLHPSLATACSRAHLGSIRELGNQWQPGLTAILDLRASELKLKQTIYWWR